MKNLDLKKKYFYKFVLKKKYLNLKKKLPLSGNLKKQILINK